MHRIILSILLLSALASAQPLEGPWLVRQTTDSSFSNLHVSLRTDKADIFYTLHNANDLPRAAHHAVFSFTTHELVAPPEALPNSPSWVSEIGDVISRDSSGWLAIVFESEYLWAGSGLNKTRLVWGANSMEGVAIVDSGYMAPISPEGGNHSNSAFSLRERIAGGWLMGWVRNGVYDLGSFSEPDNSVYISFLSPDLIEDFAVNCCGSCCLYGPIAMVIATTAHDSATIIQESMVGPEDEYLNYLPFESDPDCITFGPIHCLDLRRTNTGRMLAVSGISEISETVNLLQFDTIGTLSNLGSFGLDRNPSAIAWHPDFGFTAVAVYPSHLLLARMDTNGVQVQPTEAVYWSEANTIVEASLAMNRNGQIAVVWSEQLTGSSSATLLKTISLSWTTPLSGKDPSLILHPSFFILSAHPNPFNAATEIIYSLPQPQHLRLTVFDITGRVVSLLCDGMQQAGEHRVTFDGSDFASGIYFARLETNSTARTLKMILLK